jgi:hypothetical protein
MTGTIFSNLPNNLIMNIIKMAEDERKNDEAIQNTKKKFNRVIYQIDSIFDDEWSDSMFYCIREYNDDFIILENGKYAYEQRWDEEISALQQEMEYNHPPEYAYDWGDDVEPSWACE